MNITLKEQLAAICARNGIDFEALDFTVKADAPRYHCATCLDRGMVGFDVPYGHPLFGKMQECPNEECPTVTNLRQQRFSRLSTLAQIPREYRQWQFEAWTPLLRDDTHLKAEQRRITGKLFGLGSAWAFADAFLRGHYFTLQEACQVLELKAPDGLPTDCKNSLMLQGEPGRGKTSLAACIVNFLLERNRPVIYARVSDILDAAYERFQKEQDTGFEYDYGNTVTAIKATFKRAPVLVLDEFNLEKYSDFSRQTMEDVMRYRMANSLPTVMTCNIDFKTFQDENEGWGYRCGHAVQGMAHWITLGGLELRPRNYAVKSA